MGFFSSLKQKLGIGSNQNNPTQSTATKAPSASVSKEFFQKVANNFDSGFGSPSPTIGINAPNIEQHQEYKKQLDALKVPYTERTQVHNPGEKENEFTSQSLELDKSNPKVQSFITAAMVNSGKEKNGMLEIPGNMGSPEYQHMNYGQQLLHSTDVSKDAITTHFDKVKLSLDDPKTKELMGKYTANDINKNGLPDMPVGGVEKGTKYLNDKNTEAIAATKQKREAERNQASERDTSREWVMGEDNYANHVGAQSQEQDDPYNIVGSADEDDPYQNVEETKTRENEYGNEQSIAEEDPYNITIENEANELEADEDLYQNVDEIKENGIENAELEQDEDLYQNVDEIKNNGNETSVEQENPYGVVIPVDQAKFAAIRGEAMDTIKPVELDGQGQLAKPTGRARSNAISRPKPQQEVENDIG